MSLLAFCHWLSQTSFSRALREDPYPYPVFLIIHLLAIAFFGGMVAMNNLRVLGLAMRETPVSQVIEQFRPWKWVAFGILAISGTILTISDPLEYYDNIAFWFSLVLLVGVGLNALIFRFGVYRTVAAWDEGPDIPSGAQYSAGISLVLWILLVFVGRAIAFF
jgi:hypothetical protein